MLLIHQLRLGSNQLAGYFLRTESFDHIANFDIAVTGDANSALHAIANFADIVFESSQRTNSAFKDDHVVAQQPDFGVALDRAILHVGACDRAHFGNPASIADFGAA